MTRSDGDVRRNIVGEIAYHAGDPDKAFNHLRETVKEDALPDEEPWN